MARKRLRDDWPQRVYKYWLSPVDDIPDAVFVEAKTMVDLWNSLVEIADENRQAYNELMQEDVDYRDLQLAIERKQAEVEEAVDDWKYQRKLEKRRTSSDIRRLAEKRDQLKTELKELKEQRKALGAKLRKRHAEYIDALWQEFYVRKESILGAAPVYWADIEAVEQSFATALKNGFKTGNFPHRHNMGHSWRFAHRFTGGGVAVDTLFSRRSKRIRIDPVSPAAYDTTIPQRQRKKLARTNVSIMLAGVPIRFRTILHRPIPKDAVVKRVEIVRRKQANKWKWHMCITVEEPRSEITPQDDIRQAVWIHDYPKDGVVAEYGHNVVRLPERLRTQIRKIDQLKSHMDQHTNTAKEHILKYLSPEELPEEARCVFNAWHTARHKRIWAINWLLKSLETRPDLTAWLDTWERSHRMLYHAWSGLQPRAIKHRESYYHRVVNDILSLARGGTVMVNERPRNRWGRKTLAAPSQLRDMLKYKAKRYGAKVVFAKPEAFGAEKEIAKKGEEKQQK